MNAAPELPAQVRIPDDVVWQHVEDQVVLLDMRAGDYHALNDSGTVIWMAIAETGDAGAALERLRAVYDADDTVLTRDIAEFVAALVAGGLLATG